MRDLHKRRPKIEDLGNDWIDPALEWLGEWEASKRPVDILKFQDVPPRFAAPILLQLWRKARISQKELNFVKSKKSTVSMKHRVTV